MSKKVYKSSKKLIQEQHQLSETLIVINKDINQMNKKVFLGGTCNESEWRDHIIPLLDKVGISYFNPVVDEWDDSAMANELRERESCDFCFYGVTPKMTGTYAIAEVVDDSNKRPKKTVLVIMRNDGSDKFDYGQWKSLIAVREMVKRNGGMVFDSLKDAVSGMSNKAVYQ